ncbi:MAG: hypothetical protein ACP5DX_03970 [Paracoccaceae bacterium]
MSDHPINLDEFRRRRRTYIDRQRILSALSDLEMASSEITAGSVQEFGAVDPLAHEITAHVNAIRRAVDDDTGGADV